MEPDIVIDGSGGVKRANPEGDASDTLTVMPIGAGQEVGRSCVVMKFKGKTIMFDCGIHPAYSGLSALPYFDMIDPAEVDLLLISHFHLDHCAALPYFLEKTRFKGRVFMTHPSKAIYKMLLSDYVKVSNISVDEMLYDEQDLIKTMSKIETVNYHQEVTYKQIKFSCYNAGHVLGAAMFMVEIAGVRVLYTGDFSREEDRHLMAAEIPPGLITLSSHYCCLTLPTLVSPDVLIVESTYGKQIHEPRIERERRFTTFVSDIVRRGGRCLIPVFALGRAQELLLILDEYWEAHPELQGIPVYYASTLAKKCMTVYQTYINMMNDNIRKRFQVSNPFIFKHIASLKSMDHFDDSGPCVVMASPGMLQSGLSRELFEMWCSDKKNGVILPGYCVEGTLAKKIMSEPNEITTSTGMSVPLKLSIQYTSFSAHSDFVQTSEFIDALQPPHIVLVHGDANEMGKLKGALVSKYENELVKVHTPANGEDIGMSFRAEKIAKTVGQLAKTAPTDGTVLSGLIVAKDFAHHVMDPSDLTSFTTLATSSISQKLRVPFPHSLKACRRIIHQLYQDIEKISSSSLKVCQVVNIEHHKKGENSPSYLTFDWVTSPVNDMIVDSILALILTPDMLPSSVATSNDDELSDEEVKQDAMEEVDKAALTTVPADFVRSVLEIFKLQYNGQVEVKGNNLNVKNEFVSFSVDLVTLEIVEGDLGQNYIDDICSLVKEVKAMFVPLSIGK